MTISREFQLLLERIQPTLAELAVQESRTTAIAKCLGHLALHSVRQVGSVMRGSAVRGYSDRDLLAVWPRAQARWGTVYVSSSTMLSRVLAALRTRYPHSRIGRDGQAIACEFADGCSVDVVPAVFDAMQAVDGITRPLFLIPDGGGGWMATSPDAHNEYIKRSHAASGHKFQRVMQLLKYWRECRSPRVPLSSFHLELVFAVSATMNRVATYQELMLDAFKVLLSRQCRPIRDPLGVSGTVPACRTGLQVQQAYAALDYSYVKAERALAFESGGSHCDATAAWNLVFNGRFTR